MALTFTGPMWEWRGPSPFHFVSVPPEDSDLIAAAGTSYGWGAIPVTASLGTTTWTTSVFPKDGTYIVPIKNAVRFGEGVEIGDVVTITLTLD